MKSKNLRNSQSGFTLIELVVVIVILGILAATALPKFIDMSGDARKAATQGVAGALGSASSINYAAAIAKGLVNGGAFPASATPGVQDTSGGCSDTVATSLMQAGVTFSAASNVKGSYSLSTKTGTMAKVGDVVTCTVTNGDDTSQAADFTLIGAK